MKEFATQEEIDTIFTEVDVNSDGYINFTDFIASTLEAAGPPIGQRDYVEEVFDRMDVQRCGAITQEGLMELMGSSLSPRGARKMLTDTGYRIVDFEAFRELLTI